MTVNPNAQIVFIGAGPVGLWSAVQTKLRDPSLEIAVLEKHPKYARSHVLRLNPNSLKNTQIPEGSPYYQKFQKIITQFKEEKNIRTAMIEGKLSKLANKLGITILKNYNVTDLTALHTAFPNAKYIIGADGSNSTVRQTIFGGRIDVKKDLQFIVEIKYEVEGQARRLGFFKGAYPTLKVMRTLASEYPGKERDGKSPITLRIFIDKKAFEMMDDATFKTPYTFANADKIHDKILKNIQIWLNVKQNLLKEKRIPNSENITVTRLGIYSSQKFVKKDERGVTWCLADDAAFGVPFFKSLNNGFLEGTKLSKSIFRAIHHQHSVKDMTYVKMSSFVEGDVEAPLHSYSNYIRVLAKKEILVARIKSFILDLFLLFIRISARVPWQVNKWTEAEVRQLQMV